MNFELPEEIALLQKTLRRFVQEEMMPFEKGLPDDGDIPVEGRVVDRAIQIHGAMGLTKELPFERWYREARSRRITEDASEIQKMLIARRLIEKYS